MFIKTVMFPLVSMAEPYETFDSEGNIQQEGGSQVGLILGWIVHGLLMLVAGYLSWKVNATSTLLVKIINCIIAVVFSFVYLLYYVVVYVIRNKMPDAMNKANLNQNIPAFTPPPAYTATAPAPAGKA